MFEKIKLFLNIVIFNDFFDKNIKNESFKKYLKEFFLLRTLLLKIITLVLITLITGLIFFLVRKQLLSDPNAKIEFNNGVAFSFLNDAKNVAVVYAIKSIISIIFTSIFIFTNKWYLFIPSCLIAINGWFNVIDKSIIDVFGGKPHYHAVVDYIYLVNSVANSADVFITIGICCFVVGILFYIYKLFKQDNNSNKKEQTDDVKKE